MIPLVKICNKGENHIVITDLTQDSDEYIDESVTETLPYYERNKFKYSETCTVNIIQKNTTDKSTVIDTLYTDHTSYLDEEHYVMRQDGHYTIYHCILPTVEWFEREINKSQNLMTKGYDVYFTDGQNLFHYCDGKINSTDPDVIANVNLDNTTISRVELDEFMVYQLFNCYIKFCKALFKNINIRCKLSGDLDDITFKRDFLWMTINILKYHVEFGDFGEAQRLLEEVNYCGGFCNGANEPSLQHGGCGCNK